MTDLAQPSSLHHEGRSFRARLWHGADAIRRVMPLRRLHRWLGLVFGAWFALVGITGSILVFQPEIETWSVPAPAAGQPLPLAALLAAATAARPDIPDGPLRIWPGERFRADFRAEEGRSTLYLDPTSGAVLGEVRQASGLIGLVHSLHRGLLLGRFGDVLVGLLGIPVLVLLGAGLVLWLRKDAVPWREKLVAIGTLRGRRRLANRHRALGLRAVLPLLIAAGTGIGMAFPQTTQWALYRVIRTRTAPLSMPGQGPVDLAGAVELALAQRPGWRLAFVDLPVAGNPAQFGVELAPPQGWPGKGATVMVDPATGALPAIIPADPVGQIRGWIIALHTGTVFGLPHRLAVVVVGLMPAVLGVLGLLLWRRGRNARRQARSRAMA